MKEKIDLIQTTSSKPKKISHEALGELISIAQHKCSPTDSYDEWVQFIKKEFKVDVNVDDIIRVLTPTICEVENELLYKQYGY